jgi:uncharacterized membrane protein
LLLVPLQPAEAVTLTFEGELEVEYNPDSLTLMSGDLGAVYIMVRNVGDRRLYVQVNAEGVETWGASSPDVINDMFVLEPGGVDQVVVTIESRARFYQDPDISDVRISFRWSADAITLEGGAFRLKDPQFHDSIEYDVRDDFSNQWAWVLGIIVAAVGVAALVAIVSLVVRRRRRRMVKAPSVEPYGEGPPDRKTVLMVRHVPSSTISRADDDTPFDPLRDTRPVKAVRRGRPPPN